MSSENVGQKAVAVKHPKLVYLRDDGEGNPQLIVGVDDQLMVMPLTPGQLSNLVVDGVKHLARVASGAVDDGLAN